MKEHAVKSIASRFSTLFLASLLLASAPFAAAQAARKDTLSAPTQQQDAVRLAAAKLQSWYNPKTGLWNTTNWWNSANALTTLTNYMRVTHDSSYKPDLEQTFTANIHSAFLNQFYDDEGWWALAWIDAYDLTGQQKYLEAAEHIFTNMSGGWDDTCGGGIWWSKKRKYKNAIANELFLDVAAHLANRASSARQSKEYAAWATREWNWFQHSGMIEHDHLISDGLTSSCQDNHKTKWSYNQGVVLGGLAELSRSDPIHSPLRAANQIAKAAINHLADKQKILHDRCEPNCGPDGSQFKGIFVRNLALLYRTTPKKSYRQFVLTNASNILHYDQTPDHGLGLVWSGPPDKPNASTQTSALDTLVAALEINQQESEPR